VSESRINIKSGAARRGACLLRSAYEAYLRDHGAQFAAAIAYHALFAIAPLAVTIVAVAGLVIGGDVARDRIAELISQSFGADQAVLFLDLASSVAPRATGVWTSIAGGALVLAGATRAFLQLQTALNAVWGISVRQGTPWWRPIPARLLPLTMLLVAVVVLCAALLVDAALGWLGKHGLLPMAAGDVAPAVLVAVWVLGAFAVFAYSFRVLPDGRMPWRDIFVGAAVSTVGLAAATYVLRLYVVNIGLGSFYGIAGTFVVLVIWVNICAQVSLFGAEVAHECAVANGRDVQLAPYAVRVRRRVEADVIEGA
jgi:membrane protein